MGPGIPGRKEGQWAHGDQQAGEGWESTGADPPSNEHGDRNGRGTECGRHEAIRREAGTQCVDLEPLEEEVERRMGVATHDLDHVVEASQDSANAPPLIYRGRLRSQKREAQRCPEQRNGDEQPEKSGVCRVPEPRHIWSGAPTPIRSRVVASATWQAATSLSRAFVRSGSSPITRQRS